MVHSAGPASSNLYWTEGQEKPSLQNWSQQSWGPTAQWGCQLIYHRTPLVTAWWSSPCAPYSLGALHRDLNLHFSEVQPQQHHYTLHPWAPGSRGDMIFTTFLAGIAISIRLHGLDPVSAVALLAAHNIHFAISSPFHWTWEGVALIFLNYNVKHHLNYANNGKQALKLGKRSGC